MTIRVTVVVPLGHDETPATGHVLYCGVDAVYTMTGFVSVSVVS